VVFITGLEEGLFPISHAAEDPEELEEERRLLYVGMTRAREELVLTWARSRRRYGPRQGSAPSRFIGELPAAEIAPAGAVARAMAAPVASTADDWDARARRTHRGPAPRATHPDERLSDADGRYLEEEAIAGARAEELGLEVGDAVMHAQYGKGRIEALEGFGAAARVVVRFGGYGRKKFAAARAKLEKI